jgi:hypothetical protein
MADYKREHWVELYQAALLELDDRNLASRIEMASIAVQQRLQQLIGTGANCEEWQALADARWALRALSKPAQISERKT